MYLGWCLVGVRQPQAPVVNRAVPVGSCSPKMLVTYRPVPCSPAGRVSKEFRLVERGGSRHRWVERLGSPWDGTFSMLRQRSGVLGRCNSFRPIITESCEKEREENRSQESESENPERDVAESPSLVV